MEMDVDQFADVHLDIPLAAGFVAVAARITHRGHSATWASQVLWPTTARCYTDRRTESETQQ